MSLLLRLERRLEVLVEGVFSRWSHDRVHPVEIARRLFREMDQGAVAGLQGLMVPNAYRVFLHPGDFAPYTSLAAPLAGEFEDALRARAQELGGHFSGPVRVALAARGEIAPGEIYAEARFAENVAEPRDGSRAAPPAEAPRSPVDPDTRVYRRGEDVWPAARLRVQAGPAGAAGQEFVLNRPVTIIGRRTDQDIVLSDPSVSRAHARIEAGPEGAVIVDLDSTNGTFVNGRPVGRARVPLRGGDRIQLGTALLEYLAGS